MPSSLPRFTLSLTQEASGDLQDIFQFTLETWGEQQVLSYKEKIDNGFQSILFNPEIGRRKDDYFIGCYCFTIGRHIVFYRIEAESIQVLRILHESRDLSNSL